MKKTFSFILVIILFLAIIACREKINVALIEDLVEVLKKNQDKPSVAGIEFTKYVLKHEEELRKVFEKAQQSKIDRKDATRWTNALMNIERLVSKLIIGGKIPSTMEPGWQLWKDIQKEGL